MSMRRARSDRPKRSRPPTGHSEMINIRVEPSQRDVIDRAARALGKDRSAFIRETAYREAERVLLDRRFFALDDKDCSRFISALDAVPADNQRHDTLLRT